MLSTPRPRPPDAASLRPQAGLSGSPASCERVPVRRPRCDRPQTETRAGRAAPRHAGARAGSPGCTRPAAARGAAEAGAGGGQRRRGGGEHARAAPLNGAFSATPRPAAAAGDAAAPRAPAAPRLSSRWARFLLRFRAGGARVGWGEGVRGSGEGAAGSSAVALTPGPCLFPAAGRERLPGARVAGGRGQGCGSRSQRTLLPRRSPWARGAHCPLAPLPPRAIVRAPAASSPLQPARPSRRPPARRGRRGRTWLYLYCFLRGRLTTQGAPGFREAIRLCSGDNPTFFFWGGRVGGEKRSTQRPGQHPECPHFAASGWSEGRGTGGVQLEKEEGSKERGGFVSLRG